ncbi:hypothetical protein FOCC_FOCC006458 [Frankliniella occidentalis]|nr:hypothetical protein FOCC_FOCC006458 [Frankliniella occidentalis]
MSNLLPQGHQLPPTAHLMLQYIEGLAPNLSVTTHHFCKSCLGDLFNADDLCSICKKDTERGLFFSYNIEDVVKYWFQERNLASLIEESTTDADNTSVTDIRDGSVFKSLNVNRGKYDVNLVLATDGVTIRKGSKNELWLLMATPAEVPIHLRESFTTVIGIWYDSKKPKNMNAYFKPFSNQMASIHGKGVEWTHPQSKEVNRSQVKAPLLIADAPARAKVQNVMNYNAINGCNICEISTVKSRPIPNKKRVRIYKYRHNPKLRTKEEMHRQATMATDTGVPVMGVKGASVLSIIPTFDVSTCCFPEFMHSTLLGVTRQLVTLWMEKPGPWNMKGQLLEIDTALSAIQHPDFVHRISRMLSYRKAWKASDYYYFLLFECLPILSDILPQIFFQHLILFVRAIFTLLKRKIHHIEIEEANILLQLFVSQFERLYGDRAMTYNVHQLCHLGLSVQRFGPLHCNSAFPFEGMNGIIARGTHGTNNVAQEIVNNIRIYQGVQRLRNITQGIDSDNNLSHRIFCNGTVLGKCKNIRPEPAESALFVNANVQFYSRAKIGFEIFTSEIHKKLKTSNHYITWQCNGVHKYGSIRFFAMVDNTFCVCVRVFKIDHLNVFYHTDTVKTITHLIQIHDLSNDVVVVHQDNIQSFVKVGRVKDFLFLRPHTLHHVL